MKITIEVECCCHKKRKVPIVFWMWGPIIEQPDLLGPVFEVPMTQLTETQQVSGSVTPVTAKGNPAEVENSVFSSSDPAVLNVIQDTADPLKFVAKAVAPGAAQVQWKADADLGDGIVEISAVGDITVVAGMAVGGTITFGTPEEQ